MLLPGQFLYRWTGILHHPLRAFRSVAMQVKSFWNRKFRYNLAFHWCETQVSDGVYNPFIPQQYNGGFLKIRFTQFSIWWFIAIFWTERAMYTDIEVIAPHFIEYNLFKVLEAELSLWFQFDTSIPLWFQYLSRPTISTFDAWDMLGLP